MDKPSKSLVILMPSFEDRQSTAALIADIAKTVTSAVPYIVVVEDGSVRDPFDVADIKAAGLQGEVIYLARNMGHQRAIAAGLGYVHKTFAAERVVIMDSDGEDKPEAIDNLLAALADGTADAAVAKRKRRSESYAFRLFYVVYKLVFKLLTGRVIQFGNFSALTGKGAARMVTMQEMWVHYAASLITSRLRIAEVPTDRGKRYFGKSQMNFVGLVLHGMRSVMVFAEDVLVRVALACAILAVFAILALGTTLTLKVIGYATPGWFSTISGMMIIILLQIGVLNLVMLMIAGIMRGAPPITGSDIDAMILDVAKTD